jgi:hypothetical protein
MTFFTFHTISPVVQQLKATQHDCSTRTSLFRALGFGNPLIQGMCVEFVPTAPAVQGGISVTVGPARSINHQPLHAGEFRPTNDRCQLMVASPFSGEDVQSS